MMTNDAVNHPSHYTSGKIEVIDFIEIEDLEKAEFYLKYKIKQLKESYSFAEDQENSISANKNNISLAKS